MGGIQHVRDFPVSTSGKEFICQCRRHKRHGFDPWVAKIPQRRAWQPTLVFLLGESHRWRSLVSYSPQGPKKSDMTGQLTLPPFLITSLGSRGLPAAPPGPTCAWAAAGCHTLCVTPGPRHPGPTHPQGCPGLGLSLVRQSDSRCCLCLWAISHLPT